MNYKHVILEDGTNKPIKPDIFSKYFCNTIENHKTAGEQIIHFYTLVLCLHQANGYVNNVLNSNSRVPAIMAQRTSATVTQRPLPHHACVWPRSLPWKRMRCLFRLPFSAVLKLQKSHAKGFSPVCVLKWRIRSDFRPNFLKQIGHWCPDRQPASPGGGCDIEAASTSSPPPPP